jgi:hypothetical protein
MKPVIMGKYFFLHIPKTAGTSFRQMLQYQFKESEVFVNEKKIIELGGYPDFAVLKEKYIGELSDIKLLVGHFPFITHTLIGDNVKILAFFRDPVQRVISFLNFYKATDERYKNSSMEFIFEEEINQTSNMQVSLLSEGFFEPGLSRLDIAIENMKKMDFIGLSEDFKNSVLLSENIFNWNLGRKRKVNVTEKKYFISKELMIRIEEMNDEDIVLYDEVKKRYIELCNYYGIEKTKIK